VPLWFKPSPVPFAPHAPSWRQPLFLHYQPLRRALEPAARALRGAVLDVGCGMQPYRAWMDPSVRYTGLDREGPRSRPDVIGTADALPFDRDTFDAVLSTQVLEHVPDPALALRECARVTRPGGSVLLTVPGVWSAHEVPFDYWRFTRHGVERLLTDAGYTDISIEPAGGLWASVGQMAVLELERGALSRELIPLVNACAGWLDRRGAREELALAWVATGRRGRAP
jgi:SAM-dependent methyltransferase